MVANEPESLRNKEQVSLGELFRFGLLLRNQQRVIFKVSAEGAIVKITFLLTTRGLSCEETFYLLQSKDFASVVLTNCCVDLAASLSNDPFSIGLTVVWYERCLEPAPPNKKLESLFLARTIAGESRSSRSTVSLWVRVSILGLLTRI